MNRKKPKLPAFKSVDEESDYWDRTSTAEYDSEDVTEAFFEELRSRAEPKKKVTLRLEPELIEDLKAIARKHGMPYQSLARELLWTSVTRVAGA